MPTFFSPARFSVLEQVESAIKSATVAVLRLLFKSIPPPQVSLDHVTSVLVVRQHDQLGDMLCAVPLLRALRLRFPRAFITLITNPVNYDIMLHHPCVDAVLNYDKRGLLKLLGFYRMLRKRRYDLAIVPATVSVSLTSNVIALMSRAALRVGPASLSGKNNPTDFLFHIAVPLDWQNDPHRHQTLRNLDIIERLDIPHHSLGHQVEITEEERLQAGRLLAAFVNEHNILVGFHPGAGKVPNRWPAERFAQLANLLVERCFIGAVITAGPMDDEPVHLMLRHINCPHLVMRHKPIRDVAAILSRLNLFVTNDTGIMHVAAGMGTPTLSLFGSTDPKQWAPLGEKNRYIQSESGDIQDITVKEVFLAAVEMLTH